MTQDMILKEGDVITFNGTKFQLKENVMMKAKKLDFNYCGVNM